MFIDEKKAGYLKDTRPAPVPQTRVKKPYLFHPKILGHNPIATPAK